MTSWNIQEVEHEVEKLDVEVFEFDNERARKITTDQSEAWKQQNRTPIAE